MRSFTDLTGKVGLVPSNLVSKLGRVERATGLEHRYHKISPATLEDLAHRARVESIRASSAIEDVIVDPRTLARIAAGRSPTTRSEAEVAGYRDALDRLMADDSPATLKVPRVLEIHRNLFTYTDSAGDGLKEHDNRVVDVMPDGTRVDRFVPVSAAETPFYLRELLERFDSSLVTQAHHPIVLTGLCVLDFLVIHPFDNGNGRVARLITTALLRSQGYEVVRYVAIEGLVDRTSDAYYRALKESTYGWHEGEHDVWPWLTYLIDRVAEGYEILDHMLAESNPTVTKSQQVEAAVGARGGQPFSRSEIRDELPGVSDATITRVLQRLRDQGQIRSSGSGPDAVWHRA